MKVIYQTEIANSLTYITGWVTSTNSEAVEFDPQLAEVMIWKDGNNNPLWKLDDNGTISCPSQVGQPLNNLTASISQMSMPDLLAQIPEEIIVVINAFVNGISLTVDQINIWNAAYAIHENAAQIVVTENKQTANLDINTG